jgi:plasmid stabilization system protein ParE
MTTTIVFRAEIVDDLGSARDWYDSQLQGLGDLFIQRFEERLRAIAAAPRSFPTVVESVRRAPLNQFPYGVFYEHDADQVVVVAVLHFKRSPDQLKERL